MSKLTQIAIGSLIVGVVVFVLKLAAWRITGSVALYSDAVESVVNVVAAGVALYAVQLAQKPADREHPYGHHKAEYFAAVIEGAMILAAAFAIFTAAYAAFSSSRPVDAPWEGLGINLIAGAINGIWCTVLLRVGRKRRSPALVADGRHLLADVVSSLGVMVGLVAAYLTGLPWLDPALACLVAVNILWSGWRLITESVSGLMDEAVAPKAMTAIRAAISGGAEGAIEAHDLRTRAAGSATFIEFHLVVPESMTVGEAHVICDRIEAAIKAEVEGAVTTIHVEPPEKAKHKGVVVVG
jgi:cation diffusion facilitator family transporter